MNEVPSFQAREKILGDPILADEGMMARTPGKRALTAPTSRTAALANPASKLYCVHKITLFLGTWSISGSDQTQ